MKKIFLSTGILLTMMSVKAQSDDGEPFKFGSGITLGSPIGKAKNSSSIVYAVDVQAEYSISDQIGATLSIGYLRFAGKAGYTYLPIVPVMAGGKFSLTEKIYASAQAGLSFFSADKFSSAFTYAPGIGYRVSENVDLLIKYQSLTKGGSNLSFVGLRVGFNF